MDGEDTDKVMSTTSINTIDVLQQKRKKGLY